MCPKNLSRRFYNPRSSGCGGTVKNCLKHTLFAHFGRPGTIPSRPISHKFDPWLAMCPKKISRRFYNPRSSGCCATVKNCLKHAIFALFGVPGTIPSWHISHKFYLELALCPKNLSRRIYNPRPSGCGATVKNCL